MSRDTSLLARFRIPRGALDLLIRTLIFSFFFSLIPAISAPPAQAEEIPNTVVLRKVSETRYNLSMNLLDQYADQEISVRIRRTAAGTSQIITLPSKKLAAEGKGTVPVAQKLEKDDVFLFVLGNKVIYKENFVEMNLIDLTSPTTSPSPTPTATSPPATEPTGNPAGELPNNLVFRKVSDKRYNLSFNLLDLYTGQDVIVDRVRTSGGKTQTVLVGRKILAAEGKGTIVVQVDVRPNDLFTFRIGSSIIFSRKFGESQVIDLTAPTKSTPKPSPTATRAPVESPTAEIPNNAIFKEVSKSKYYFSFNLLDKFANKQIVIERYRKNGAKSEVFRYPPKTLAAEGKGTIVINQALRTSDDFLFRYRGKAIFKQNFGLAALYLVKDGKLEKVREATPRVIPGSTPAPTPTPSVTPTPTPTPSVTPTPTPTPSVTPTPTPSPVVDTSTPIFTGGGGGQAVFAPVVTPPVATRYAASFDSNTAETGTVPSSIANLISGDAITLPTPDTSLVRSGYKFIGWNTAANGSGTYYFPGDRFVMTAANRTFFAQWINSATYVVRYYPNGPETSTVLQIGSSPTALYGAIFTRSGYRLASWNTVQLGGGTSYALGANFNFASDITVYAQWVIDPTVTVTQTTGGTISPITGVKTFGSSETYTATATTGYSFVNWVVGGVNAGSANSYVLSNITSNQSISALFAIDTFTLTVNPPANGTISPTTRVKNYGSSETFTATAASGYRLVNWLVDGVNAGTGSTKVISDIRANMTISAVFTIETYTVTVVQPTGGTISPTTLTKDHGSSETFTATAGTGYDFVQWTINGVAGSTSSTLVLSNITSNRTISALFTRETFSLTVNQATGGTIAPTSATKTYGSSETYTATLTPGYHMVHWLVDGIPDSTSLTQVVSNITSNRTISALFELDTFTITTVATNGSISPSSPVKNYGSTETFTATAGTGYRFVRWTIAGSTVGTSPTYVLSNITGNRTLTAVFALETFTVTVNQVSNGSITPVTAEKDYGTTETYTATASTGYHFLHWLVGGVNAGATNPYVLSNITSNKTISAVFEIDTYTLTVEQPANGTISPSTVIRNYGDSETFTATANTGYHLVNWVIDGVNAGGGSTKILTGISADKTISAIFAIDTFTVTVNQRTGGTISPTTGSKNYGSSETYTATAATGYHFLHWIVNGVDAGTSTTYVLSNITSNKTITAHFELETFTIAVIQPNNGTITPGNRVKNYGSSETFTATANTGYHLENWFMDGTYYSPTPTFVVNSITADHTVSAVFAIDTYTVTVNQAANGSITANRLSVNYGESVTVFATPVGGYLFSFWLINGTSVAEAETYTINSIDGNLTISAVFALDEFGITVVQPSNGSISPTSYAPTYGTTETFTATPNTGYHFVKWIVDGVSYFTNAPYVLSNITASHTISALFELDTFTVTVVQSNGGAISPITRVKSYGSAETYTATADTGYHLAHWIVGGVNVGSASTYVLRNIRANETVTALFELDTFTVTVAQPIGGDISPVTTVLNYGQSQLFTATADTGYGFTSWVINGEVVLGTDTYLVETITADVSIGANFDPFTYRIFVSDPDNGSISPSGDQTVNYGDVVTFTATPDDGYYLVNWLVDGVPVSTDPTYTTESITADFFLNATFDANTYTITLSEGLGGTTSYSAWNLNQITHGETFDFYATPSMGYRFIGWYVDGELASTGDTYSFGPVTSNHTVSSVFEMETYTLTVTQAVGGTISPETTIENYGNTAVFTATPDDGYQLVNWIINGSPQGGSLSIDIINVMMDQTITAEFSRIEYTVTVTSEMNGTVTNYGTNLVYHGDSITVAATPFTDYVFAEWQLDGALVSTDPTYTLSNVTADHTLAASYTYVAPPTPEGNYYRVTLLPGEGSGEPIVFEGYGSVFTLQGADSFTAPANSFFSSWRGSLGDYYPDVTQDWGSPSFTFDSDFIETFTATYQTLNYIEVNIVNPESGTASIVGRQYIQPGEDATFETFPNSGYRVAYFMVDDNYYDGEAILNIGPIESDRLIDVYFEEALPRVYYLAENEDFDSVTPEDLTEYQPGDVVTILEPLNDGEIGTLQDYYGLESYPGRITGWSSGPDGSGTVYQYGETLTLGIYDLELFPIVTYYRFINVDPSVFGDALIPESMTVRFNSPILDRADWTFKIADIPDQQVHFEVPAPYYIHGLSIYLGDEIGWNWQDIEATRTYSLELGQGYPEIAVLPTIDTQWFDWWYDLYGFGADSANIVDSDDGYDSIWTTPEILIDYENVEISTEFIDQDGNRYMPDTSYPLEGERDFTLRPVMTRVETLTTTVDDSDLGYITWDTLTGLFDYQTDTYYLLETGTSTFLFVPEDGETVVAVSVNGVPLNLNLLTLMPNDVRFNRPYFSYTIDSVTPGMTIHVEFEPKYNYTILLDPNGGIGSEVNLSGYGRTFIVPEIEFTRAGYEATCWIDLEHQLNDATLCPGDEVVLAEYGDNANFDLVPDWERIPLTYSVNYLPGRGEGTPLTINGIVGFTYTLTGIGGDAGFTRKSAHLSESDPDDWIVIGWNTKSDYSGRRLVTNDTITVETETINLYAEWLHCYNDDCAARASYRNWSGNYTSTYFPYIDGARYVVGANNQRSTYIQAPGALRPNADTSPGGLNFIGWNTSASADGRWFLAGDSFDPLMNDNGNFASSEMPEYLHAFWSQACTVPEICNTPDELYMPQYVKTDSHMTATVNSAFVAGNFYVKHGETATITFNFEPGYCLASLSLAGSNYNGSLENLVADRARYFEATSERCRYDLYANYYFTSSEADIYATITASGVSEYEIVDFSGEPFPIETFRGPDYQFLGWATNPESATAGIATLQSGDTLTLTSDTLNLYAVWRDVRVYAQISVRDDNPDQNDGVYNHLSILPTENGSAFEFAFDGENRDVVSHVGSDLTLLIQPDTSRYSIGQIIIGGSETITVNADSYTVTLLSMETDTPIEIVLIHKLYDYTLTLRHDLDVPGLQDVVLTDRAGWVRLPGTEIFGLQSGFFWDGDQLVERQAVVSGWGFGAAHDLIELTEDTTLELWATWEPGYQIDIEVVRGTGGTLIPRAGHPFYENFRITDTATIYGQSADVIQIFEVLTEPGSSVSAITFQANDTDTVVDILNGEFDFSIYEILETGVVPTYLCEINNCGFIIPDPSKGGTVRVTFATSQSYQLNFAANGGRLIGDETDTPIIGQSETFTYPANIYRKDGYSFAGWQNSAHGNTVFQPGDIESLIAPSVFTLTPVWNANQSGVPVTYLPGDGTGNPLTLYISNEYEYYDLATPDFLPPNSDLYQVWWFNKDGTRFFNDYIGYLGNGPDTFTAVYGERIPFTLVLADPESGSVTFEGITLDESHTTHTFDLVPGRNYTVTPSPDAGNRVANYIEGDNDENGPYPRHQIWQYLGGVESPGSETLTIYFERAVTRIRYETGEGPQVELPYDSNIYSAGDVVNLASLTDYGINETNSVLFNYQQAITGWYGWDGTNESTYSFGETVTLGLYDLYLYPDYTDYTIITVAGGSEDRQIPLESYTATFSTRILASFANTEYEPFGNMYAVETSPDLTMTIHSTQGLEIMDVTEYYEGNYSTIASDIFSDSYTVNVGDQDWQREYLVTIESASLNFQINEYDSNDNLVDSTTDRWATFTAPDSALHPTDNLMIISWDDRNGNSYLPGNSYPVPSEGYIFNLYPVYGEYKIIDNSPLYSLYANYEVYAPVSLTLSGFGRTAIPLGGSAIFEIRPFDNNSLYSFTVNGSNVLDNMELIDGWYRYSIDSMSVDILLDANIGLTGYDYTVSFDIGEGEVEGTQEAMSGFAQSFTIPSTNISRYGYDFTCWADLYDENAPRLCEGDVVDLTQPNTPTTYNLVATWSRSIYDYVITFDPGYGTGDPYDFTGTGSSFTLENESFSALSQMAFGRTGWEIAGWNTSREMDGNNYDLTFTDELFAETMTYYAEWTRCYDGDCSLRDNRPEVYDLGVTSDFNVDYMELTAITQTFDYGYLDVPTMEDLVDSLSLPDGIEFNGWNSEPDGSGDVYLPGDRHDMWSNDTATYLNGFDTSVALSNFYAMYGVDCELNGGCWVDLVPIQFTYDSNISSIDIQAEHLEEFFAKNDTVTFRPVFDAGYCLNTITRNGATFVGSLESITADRAMTFNLTSARCTYNLTVNVHDSATAGSLVTTTPGVLADYPIAMPNPVRADHTFLGWATTPNGSPTYQRNSVIMLTSATLNLYAIWRYNFVKVTFQITADQDPILEDVYNHIGINGIDYPDPFWVRRGSDGLASESFTITKFNNSTLYIIDSITVGSSTTYCSDAPCNVVDLVDMDTNVVVTIYAHHAIFNYSITYVGIDTSTTITGSGSSITLADPTIFGIVPNSANGGTADGFVGSWELSVGGQFPTGFRGELVNNVVETLTANWAAGYEVNVIVAFAAGGTVRWVYPGDAENATEYMFSTRSSQRTYWYEDQMPYLPRFKVEADSGYELTSIQYQGQELIGTEFDATYRSGRQNEQVYQCVGNDPTECYFTLATLDARAPIGDLFFEFKQKFNYSLAFDGGGGTLLPGESDTSRTGFATRADLPANLYSREGYTFTNWQDSLGQGYREDNVIEINRDYFETFTAMWQIQSFAVTFAGIENASVTSNSNHDGAYDYGSGDTFTLTPNDGFCTSSNPVLTGPASISVTNYGVNRSFTLSNIAGEITVTFDVHPCAYQFVFGQENNDGSSTGIPVSVGTDRYLTLGFPTSVPDGARFLNWATNADGSGDTYTAGALIDLFTESFTASSLYGQWAVSPVVQSASMLNIDSAPPVATTSLSSFITDFDCEYWEFGWDANGAPLFYMNDPYIHYLTGTNQIRCSNFTFIPGTRMEDDYVPAYGELVIRWPIINISFNTGVESMTATSIYSTNTNLFNLPTLPTREGYIFLGWNLSSNPLITDGAQTGTVRALGDFAVTMYAKWQVDLSNA